MMRTSRLIDNTLAFSPLKLRMTAIATIIAVLLAGGGCGAHRPGRHIKWQTEPLWPIFLTMLQSGGVDIDTFGSDGTSTVSELG